MSIVPPIKIEVEIDEKITATRIVKTAVSIVVGSGVTKIVAGIIKNNTSPTNWFQKGAVLSAAFVIGSIIADVSKDYTDSKIDDGIAWYQLHIKSKF